MLSGNNTYTGETIISAGTLQIGDGVTTGEGLASPTIIDNATLAFNAAANETVYYQGVISGAGSVVKNGPGTMCFFYCSFDRYTGGTTVNGGTFEPMAGNNGLPCIIGTVNINPGATVLTPPNVSNVFGASTVNIVGGTLFNQNYNGASGCVYNLTGGTMTGASDVYTGIGGINTYASTATSVFGGLAYLAQATTVFNVASGTAPGGVDFVVSGTLNDQGAGYGIQKTGSGNMAIIGTTAYSGATTISAGTLQLGDGAANNGYVVGNIVDNAALVFANQYVQTYSGAISGSGGKLIMAGPCALTLSGTANSYTGGTAINGGLLAFSNTGAIPSSGSISINSGGALAVNGAYSTVGSWISSNKIAASSVGVLAISGTDAETINMTSLPSVGLGTIGAATFSGAITAGTNGYRLGGAGGVLTVSTALTAPTA